jgi:tetratricopeptide (TPR) repeat protein
VTRAFSRTAAFGATAIALAVACGGSPKRRPDAPARAALSPVNPEALAQFDAALRALALEGSDAREKAKDRLRAAVEIDKTLWEAWHNLGVVLFAQGEDDEAAAAFGRALAINRNHRPSLLARAEAYRRAGHAKRARKDYEKALERNAEDADTGARLASLLRESREYEDAIDVIRETLRTAGANAKVYVELGLIYMAQGRAELAELVFHKATELDANEPSIYNGLALLALDRGDAQRAFDKFDQATALDPNYLAARFNKASVLLDAGDYARAKAELLVVVESSPQKAHFAGLVALGVAHRGLKEYDQAKAVWESVVKAAPKRSRVRGDALYNLAVLEMDFFEDEKAAAAALSRYLEHAPPKHPQRKEAQVRRRELRL